MNIQAESQRRWVFGTGRGVATLGLLVLVGAIAAACSTGVAQSEYEKAKQQLSTQEQKAAARQQQLSAKVQETTGLQGKLTTSEPLQLYIYADTVTAGPGESKYNYDATGIKAPSCVLASFKRGMQIVWRYEIVDAAIGKRLTDKEVATAIVRLPHGEEIKSRFGRYGSTADAPWFWISAWDVPLDYPLGVLDWSIQVTTKDGKPWGVNIPDRGIELSTQIVD